MILKQLFDYESYTYTYLLGDEKTGEAVLIDSVFEQAERDHKLAKEMGLSVKYLLETHVHADHVTAISKMKKFFPEAKSVVSIQGGAECTDIKIDEGDEIIIGNLKIKVLSTPGHTNGCVSYYTEGMIFTGDALFIRGSGRTDFQQGSADKLYESVVNKLFKLPEETIVYPGHDYKGMTNSTIGEEKRLNLRFLGKTKEEFIEFMSNLKLENPKKIHEAVPANLKCGKRGEKKETKL